MKAALSSETSVSYLDLKVQLSYQFEICAREKGRHRQRKSVKTLFLNTPSVPSLIQGSALYLFTWDSGRSYTYIEGTSMAGSVVNLQKHL